MLPVLMLFGKPAQADPNDKNVQVLVSYGGTNNGSCSGSGICGTYAADASNAPATAVNTTVKYNPSNPTQVSFTFSMSDLLSNDPIQYANVSSILASQSTPTPEPYIFTNDVSLTGSEFAALGLNGNAHIVGNKPESIYQIGDDVTINMTIADNGISERNITLGVSYGNPPAGGGSCTGGGLCMRVAVNTTPLPTKSVYSTFSYDTKNPYILKITFSMAEMAVADPSQYAFLTGILASQNTANPTPYMFPTDYALDAPDFAALGLGAGAFIMGLTPATLTQNGDALTIELPISRGGNGGTIQLTVSYGNKPSSGSVCVGGGLCKHKIIDGTIGDATEIKTALKYDPSTPNQITLTFSATEVNQNDPNEFIYLNSIVSSQNTPTPVKYQFANAYPLTDAVFRKLGLPATAKIVSDPAVNSLTLNGDTYTLVLGVQL